VIAVARERELTQAFVELADTLVTGYDVADLLYGLVEHCVSLLDAAAAAIMLADQRGGLQVMAASTERTRLLELFQLQNDEGPYLDCFRTGHPVAVPDLAVVADRWPGFAAAAGQEGYAAVHALPFRLRDQIIGALNLFRSQPGTCSSTTCRWPRPLPTSPLSASCTSAPSTATRLSSDNSKAPSTAESSSNKLKACWPNAAG
jgi:transcriptional regulator with GAF, ATPase, and Fis domain